MAKWMWDKVATELFAMLVQDAMRGPEHQRLRSWRRGSRLACERDARAALDRGAAAEAWAEQHVQRLFEERMAKRRAVKVRLETRRAARPRRAG